MEGAQKICFILILTTLLFAEKKITDFRLIPTSAMDLDIYLDFNSYIHDDYNSSYYHLSGDVGFDLNGKMESEERIFEGDISFAYRPGFTKQSDDSTISSYTEYDSYLRLSEYLEGIFYINRSKFFLRGLGKGWLYWDYSKSDDTYWEAFFGDYYASGEIGFGRLRDGTSIWKALEIERILMEEQLIDNPLSKDEILKIAQIISKEWSYRLQYERFSKFYYADIEKILEEEGINIIPAYVWFKIKEIIDEEVEPREFGLRLSTGLVGDGSAHLSHYDTVIELYGDPRIRYKLSIDGSYPLTYRLQSTNSLEMYIDDEGVSFYFDVAFSYRVSTKIDLLLKHNLDHFKYQHDTEKRLTQSLIFSFVYYLEDRVRFSFDNALQHQWKEYDNNPRNYFSSSLSLSYDAL